MRSTSSRSHAQSHFHSQQQSQSQQHAAHVVEEPLESSIPIKPAKENNRMFAGINVFAGLPPLAHETRTNSGKSFSAPSQLETFDAILMEWLQQSPLQEKTRRAEAKTRLASAHANGWIKLDLSRLGLSSLPTCLNLLIKLEELDISENALAQLPRLSEHLHTLSIAGNLFNEVPHLPSALQVLNVSDNPWSQNAMNILHLLPRSLHLIDTRSPSDHANINRPKI